MVEAARKGFGARIGNVFEDPRSHIVYEDAKTFFASAREPYDLIVSEPSNPWVSGVATLFSDEFYGRIVALPGARRILRAVDAGLRDRTLGVLASVMKALAPHFGAYALYNTDDSDILIIATRGAALPTPDDRLLQSPELRAELTRIGVQSVADIELRKIGDNVTIGPLLQTMPVPANSDFFLSWISMRRACATCARTRSNFRPDPAADSVPGATGRFRGARPDRRALTEQRARARSPGAPGA